MRAAALLGGPRQAATRRPAAAGRRARIHTPAASSEGDNNGCDGDRRRRGARAAAAAGQPPRPFFSTPVASPAALLSELRAWAHAGRHGAPEAAMALGAPSGAAPALPKRALLSSAASAYGGGNHASHAAPALPPRGPALAGAALARRDAAELDGATARPPLPPSFAGDAERVASGQKRLLGDGSRLDFGCTACGACCRSFADTVLCDPADLWRLGTAPAVAKLAAAAIASSSGVSPPVSPRSPLDLRPSAFRVQLGHFTTAALPPGVSLPGFLAARTGVVAAAAAGGAGYGQHAAAFVSLVRQRCAEEGLPVDDDAARAAAFPLLHVAAEPDAPPLPPPALEGLLPVVFLRSRPAGATDAEVDAGIAEAAAADAADGSAGYDDGSRVSVSDEPVSHGRARPGSPQGSLSYALGWRRGRRPWDAHLQCAWAVPHPHTPPTKPAAAAVAPVPASYGDASNSSSATGSGSGVGGLACSLGPAAMPTACALYPLGDLWSSPAIAQAQPSAADAGPADGSSDSERVHFYSLDHRRCEGVVDAAVGAPSATPASVPAGTVASYRARNDLATRRAGGEWFAALATAVAVVGPDQALAAAVERLEAAAVEAAVEAAAQDDDGVAAASLFLAPVAAATRVAVERDAAAQEAVTAAPGGRRKRLTKTSSAAPAVTVAPEPSHIAASAVQARLTGILYHFSGLDADDDTAACAGSRAPADPPSTMLPQTQTREWAALRRRIEASAVRYVVGVVDASQRLAGLADALDAWTAGARARRRAHGSESEPMASARAVPAKARSAARRGGAPAARTAVARAPPVPPAVLAAAANATAAAIQAELAPLR